MANEKETPGPKEDAAQQHTEPEETKTAGKKETAAEDPNASEAGKPAASEKTEPLPETAGSEEIRSQESEPTAEPPSETAAAQAAGSEEFTPEPSSTEPARSTGADKSDTPPPPPPDSEPDPLKTFGIYAGVAFLILIVLIVGASMQNAGKYYVIDKDGAVEIWKGQFSPMGRERLLVMPGVQPPDNTKEVYTKADVYPLIFEFYLAKADALMDVAGAPNFEDVKSDLNRALQYATTAEMRSRARTRIQTIDRLTLLYKADVAAARGSVEGYRSALAYLQEARDLDPDEIEANLIRQKIQSIEKQMTALEQKETADSAAASGPESETPSAAEEGAGQQSAAPQPPDTGQSSPEQNKSTRKPVDF